MRKNYVYFVKNISTGLKYVGARFGKNCTPEDFWIIYFTSSKSIKLLIDIYGKEDFEFKILKTFEKEYDAKVYEQSLLKYAVLKNDYLNLHTGFNFLKEEDYQKHVEKMYKIHSLQGNLSFLKKTGIFGLSKKERIQISSNGGTKAGILNKIRNTGIFDKEVQKRQHITLKEKQLSAYYNPILKAKISSNGGKNGLFSKKYLDRNDISEEDFKIQQSLRGQKGGPKNKGFIWYNDGSKTYKYTKIQQLELDFDTFIKNNKNFKKGRIKYENKIN